MDRLDVLAGLLLLGLALLGAGVWMWAGLPATLVFAGAVCVVAALGGLVWHTGIGT